YDITQHPNYKYLSDADKKNAFDVERYIRAQRKKKHTPAVIAPEEVFDLYDIELPETDSPEAAEA
ncbi:MAG: type VI secretion protein, partial [Clostridia bacterium]|nr:type VI secretion protein [Clostridia bacterium]